MKKLLLLATLLTASTTRVIAKNLDDQARTFEERLDDHIRRMEERDEKLSEGLKNIHEEAQQLDAWCNRNYIFLVKKETVRQAREDLPANIFGGVLHGAIGFGSWKLFSIAAETACINSVPWGFLMLTIGLNQCITEKAAKNFSSSILMHTERLDKNLRLNVIEAAF